MLWKIARRVRYAAKIKENKSTACFREAPAARNNLVLFPMLRLRTSVRSPAVQVDQNVPRLRAFAWADNAPILQFIHDARRARVAEAQAPLQQRDARLLFAADDFDALLDQIFVFIAAAFLAQAADGFGK